MSNTKQGDGLQHLVTLRQREVDSLTSDMAAKEKVRQRVVTTLARIESLCEGSGASGAASPVYSLNCANYKQAVLQMAQRQREDLARHDADIAASRQALQAAALRREVLTQVMARQREAVAREERRSEQKSQDDMGAQLWWRTRT